MTIGPGRLHPIRFSAIGEPKTTTAMRNESSWIEFDAVKLLTFPTSHGAIPRDGVRAQLAFDSLSQLVLRQLERLAPSTVSNSVAPV
jgi:hypothetical protein